MTEKLLIEVEQDVDAPQEEETPPSPEEVIKQIKRDLFEYEGADSSKYKKDMLKG